MTHIFRKNLNYLKKYKILILFLSLITNFINFSTNAKIIKTQTKVFEISYEMENKNYENLQLLSNLNWEKIEDNSKQLKKRKWEIYNPNLNYPKKNFLVDKKELLPKESDFSLYSFNRSIVYGNNIGPDISWLIPPGFKWTKNKKIDASIRGYNQTLSHRRKKNEGWGWNKGDAVGQFYYQFLNKEKYSFGTNIGIRSISDSYDSPVGDGLSAGLRGDYKISNTSGIAFGAEQLLHFDEYTDTGRDIYLTLSKGFWSNNKKGNFPLKVATAGVATGRMAEGNIRGFCSDLFGGAATEIQKKRRLCWAPVYSLAYLFNEKMSTFFEYNSRFFLVGSSIVPFKEIPLRSTFAITLSDHIHNYKLNKFDEITWTFRLSLGL